MICRICLKLLSLSILVLLTNGYHERYSNYYSNKKPAYKKIRYVEDFTAVLGMYLSYNDNNFFNKPNYQGINTRHSVSTKWYTPLPERDIYLTSTSSFLRIPV